MDDILDRIDRSLDGLCPCGADPRPDDPYCSDDCTPTHVAHDTDTRMSGDYATAMRWRPDLITAVDDSDLYDLGSVTFYEGRHNARLYQRGIPEQGEPATWHLRLDDGHRYVGFDLPGVDDILTAEHEQRVADAWARLERELGNSRHLEPDPDPWADVLARDWLANGRQRLADWQLGVATSSARAGETVTVALVDEQPRPGRAFIAPIGSDPASMDGWTELGTLTEDGISYQPSGETTWDSSRSNPLGDIRVLMRPHEDIFADALRALEQGIRYMQPTVQQIIEQIHGCECEAEEPERHPMLTAIEARRNRNTGPEQRPRPPRQINPRRR